jgi:hypothetical protein
LETPDRARSADLAGIGESAAELLRRFGRKPEVPDSGHEVSAVPVPQADVDADRQRILASFRRTTTPPTPAPSPPSSPQPRPPERQAEPEAGMTDDGWRFILHGFVAGTLAWSTRHRSPPKAPGCKVPVRVLKEFGF